MAHNGHTAQYADIGALSIVGVLQADYFVWKDPQGASRPGDWSRSGCPRSNWLSLEP